MGGLVEVPIWLFWVLTVYLGAATGAIAWLFAERGREPQYMQVRATTDQHGNPTIEPVYPDDEDAAVAESFRRRSSGTKPYRIPGLSDGD